MGKLIQIKVASRRLGLTDQTLRNWGANGILNIKKIGRIFYVDEDTINSLSDNMKDVEHSRAALEKIYNDNIRSARDARVWFEDERAYRRYVNICVEECVQNKFFAVVLDLLETCEIIDARESEILKQRLNGVPLDDIAQEYGLTHERIRQIAMKAIRKSRYVNNIGSQLKKVQALEADNEALKLTIVGLKAQLFKYKGQEASYEEAYGQYSDNEAIYKLLTQELKDLDISVRALNVLCFYEEFTGQRKRIYTVGDLARLTPQDILRQRNAGKKTLNELGGLLSGYGLRWGYDVEKVYRLHVEMSLQNQQKS